MDRNKDREVSIPKALQSVKVAEPEIFTTQAERGWLSNGGGKVEVT